VGAAAGGSDDRDRAPWHGREPVGFVDTLKIASDFAPLTPRSAIRAMRTSENLALFLKERSASGGPPDTPNAGRFPFIRENNREFCDLDASFDAVASKQTTFQWFGKNSL
jgi:hypothetical protein